ncbi:TetR/AcrR family transcriptional regulator [Winogradskyella bathintestinalis]|uniref:TetR/AcrR family transcriptional regulator n=1 Tax=Winogradskyella bathintestinalis TaxID=3035208 RepID=A0ABT7ZT96_9FLAO|nr:TetR/AcrR family transcriptional regulator [Winogradskyella bathintestinalis]MDN3492194.1 TetR/AcrR family transcriptional regulator [Winogradskyella bathintestinalis]
MISKAELLTYSINKFTELGSKHVTLDDLAKGLGISKKTIYSFFANKEDLVTCGVESLVNDYKQDINRLIDSNSTDSILCVILIYQRGFEYLKRFKPSFLYGLEKYYPKASRLFNNFVEDLANYTVYKLLLRAQEAGNIKNDVDIELIIKIYFFRIDHLLFKDDNSFEFYDQDTLLKHFIIFNLKGIVASHYSNTIFEKS